jgi:hypothetical protein
VRVPVWMRASTGMPGTTLRPLSRAKLCLRDGNPQREIKRRRCARPLSRPAKSN